MWHCYKRNGLLFWSEEEIRLRQRIADHLLDALRAALLKQNPAFQFRQIEAPILTPKEFINPNYSEQDMYLAEKETDTHTGLVLRPETTMGSYEAAKAILDPYSSPKTRLPLVVWQHGKSFRREQDQVTKNMRLKEFYQLEFQILFAMLTANDYATAVIPAMTSALSQLIGPCRTEPSDRLPDYSEQTTDIICDDLSMEVCSISKRKDFPGAKCLEVAIGTDRCVYCALERSGVLPEPNYN